MQGTCSRISAGVNPRPTRLVGRDTVSAISIPTRKALSFAEGNIMHRALSFAAGDITREAPITARSAPHKKKSYRFSFGRAFPNAHPPIEKTLAIRKRIREFFVYSLQWLVCGNPVTPSHQGRPSRPRGWQRRCPARGWRCRWRCKAPSGCRRFARPWRES